MAIDVSTLIAAVLGAGTTAFAVLQWSSKPFFDRHLEAYKTGLSRDNALLLGDAEADRKYRFEARQRLHNAVGPLRFQLIQTAVQVRDRIFNIVEYGHDLGTRGYFYRSTLYRTCRLIALLELIEREMGYADFSVDDAMLRIVRFRRLVFQAFSGSWFLLDHPGCDWTIEREHLFRDTLPVIAAAMLTAGANGQNRVVRVDEFNAVLAQGRGYLEPIATQIAALDPRETPVLWLRIIAVAAICDALLRSEPQLADALGAKDNYDFAPLLAASDDPFIAANCAAYAKAIGELAAGLR
ncbi:MAG: hypothetical protein DCF31_02280 [Alphaproteobacteria bacterium]|nr:MAG: hypothetical protein DCF31_02280 [Alphaproteobacteria bacterium]